MSKFDLMVVLSLLLFYERAAMIVFLIVFLDCFVSAYVHLLVQVYGTESTRTAKPTIFCRGITRNKLERRRIEG